MSEPGNGDQASEHGPRCPVCGKPRSEEYRPFCSKRCADVDLGRWLSGRYAIPGQVDADEDGEEAGSRTGAKPDPGDGGQSG